MNADQDKTRARIDLLAMAVGLLRRYVMGPGLLWAVHPPRVL